MNMKEFFDKWTNRSDVDLEVTTSSYCGTLFRISHGSQSHTYNVHKLLMKIEDFTDVDKELSMVSGRLIKMEEEGQKTLKELSYFQRVSLKALLNNSKQGV